MAEDEWIYPSRFDSKSFYRGALAEDVYRLRFRLISPGRHKKYRKQLKAAQKNETRNRRNERGQLRPDGLNQNERNQFQDACNE